MKLYLSIFDAFTVKACWLVFWKVGVYIIMLLFIELQ